MYLRVKAWVPFCSTLSYPGASAGHRTSQAWVAVSADVGRAGAPSLRQKALSLGVLHCVPSLWVTGMALWEVTVPGQ